jgi:hypothetical protein
MRFNNDCHIDLLIPLPYSTANDKSAGPGDQSGLGRERRENSGSGCVLLNKMMVASVQNPAGSGTIARAAAPDGVVSDEALRCPA